MAVMDEFKEERERIKSAPFKKRLEHFWEYNKVTVIIAAFATYMICSIGYGIITKKESALMVALIDCYSNEEETEAYKLKLEELMGIDTKKEEILIDNSFFLTAVDTPDASTAEVLGLRIMARELDVMVAGDDVFDRYVQNGIFKDMREILSPEQLAYYEDSFYYVDMAVIEEEGIYNIDFSEQAFIDETDHRTPEGMKKPVPVGIYVTGTETFQGIYYFLGGSQEVVFGLPFYTENVDNALVFLDDMTGRVQ